MRTRALLALGILVVVVGVFATGYWIRGASEVLPVASEAAASARPGLPNARITPGAVNPAVTPDTLESTICKPGWTATVRPPAAYTNAVKIVQIVEYGYRDKDPRHYQEDHLVPLELGGATRDPRNLWPQPNTATTADGTAIGADEKDDLEDELKRRVCAGTMALSDAQRLIAGDWVTAWNDLGQP